MIITAGDLKELQRIRRTYAGKPVYWALSLAIDTLIGSMDEAHAKDMTQYYLDALAQAKENRCEQC